MKNHSLFCSKARVFMTFSVCFLYFLIFLSCRSDDKIESDKDVIEHNISSENTISLVTPDGKVWKNALVCDRLGGGYGSDTRLSLTYDFNHEVPLPNQSNWTITLKHSNFNKCMVGQDVEIINTVFGCPSISSNPEDCKQHSNEDCHAVIIESNKDYIVINIDKLQYSFHGSTIMKEGDYLLSGDIKIAKTMIATN